MTGFGELVAVSAAVAATRSRTEKVRMLADFLRSVPPGAVASALWFLSGRSGRERLGIGPAAVERAWSAAAPAAEATLGLEDVVGALAGLPDLAGEGSAADFGGRPVLRKPFTIAGLERAIADAVADRPTPTDQLAAE